MSEATTGAAHAKARVSGRELPRHRLVVDEAHDVDPLLRHAEPREQQPHGERIGAEHSQTEPATAQTRPGAQQHGQTLAWVMAAREDDAVGAVARVDPVRDLDSVRDHLVVSRRIRRGRQNRLLRDGHAQVDSA
jgi:hypothetical protein